MRVARVENLIYGIELNFGMVSSQTALSQQSTSEKLKETVEEEESSIEEVLNENENESLDLIEQKTETIENIDQSIEQHSSNANQADELPDNSPIEGETKVTESESVQMKESAAKSQNQQQDDPVVPGKEESKESQATEKVQQGNPKKTVDERALLKNDGSSSAGQKGDVNLMGATLELAGWAWDEKPRPKDSSTENGKIVFEIKVDDTGFITGIKTIESTVTPEVERVYYESIQRLSFSPTADNIDIPPTSTGKVTFIIRSN